MIEYVFILFCAGNCDTWNSIGHYWTTFKTLDACETVALNYGMPIVTSEASAASECNSCSESGGIFTCTSMYCIPHSRPIKPYVSYGLCRKWRTE